MLREAPLEDNRKRELSTALHVYFKDWLYGNDPYYTFCTILFVWVLLANIALKLSNLLYFLYARKHDNAN